MPLASSLLAITVVSNVVILRSSFYLNLYARKRGVTATATHKTNTTACISEQLPDRSNSLYAGTGTVVIFGGEIPLVCNITTNSKLIPCGRVQSPWWLLDINNYLIYLAQTTGIDLQHLNSKIQRKQVIYYLEKEKNTTEAVSCMYVYTWVTSPARSEISHFFISSGLTSWFLINMLIKKRTPLKRW